MSYTDLIVTAVYQNNFMLTDVPSTLNLKKIYITLLVIVTVLCTCNLCT